MSMLNARDKKSSQNLKVDFRPKLASPESKIEMPQITHELLRAKYQALKRGVDTLDYIKTAIEVEKQKKEERERIRATYDYSRKRVVGEDEPVR